MVTKLIKLITKTARAASRRKRRCEDAVLFHRRDRIRLLPAGLSRSGSPAGDYLTYAAAVGAPRTAETEAFEVIGDGPQRQFVQNVIAELSADEYNLLRHFDEQKLFEGGVHARTPCRSC